MIKFSIIVPVYNVEKYIRKCFDSIVSQSYKNVEVIIICDKSSDNSEAIVNDYVKKHNNFKNFYYENTGLGRARNLGIKKATGDYILFLDSDDYLENDCLEILARSLNDLPDVLRFQVQEIKDNKFIKYEEEPFENLNGIEAFNYIVKYHYVENSWCYCYKRNFYIKNEFKFVEGCIAEDYGLTPLIIAKAESVKSVSYIGYNYVQRENSLMSNKDYVQKLRKMNDMLLQAKLLKKELSKIKNTERFMAFINNSLIYYSTTLKYNDYKKINKILKKENCFKYLKEKGLKATIRNFLIKKCPYFFYNYIMR